MGKGSAPDRGGLGPGRRSLRLVLPIVILASGAACGPSPVPAPPTAVQRTVLKTAEPDPEVKIKVRRSVAGQYSWDLGGDDVDAILNADARLRKALVREEP